MDINKRLLVFFFFILLVKDAFCMFESFYCGLDNCYDLLGVTRDHSKADISKAYRTLARKWHPDRHKSSDKDEAAVMFRKIATAYETLKDDEVRRDYDYLLDNPDEFYSHYYRYYRRKAPKVNVTYVIIITITVISAVQYFSSLNNYKSAIDYFATIPKYRIQAQHYIRSEGLIDTSNRKRKGKTKEEIREEEESLIKSYIREKLDIRGAYSKPTVFDTLWVQLITSPYYLVMYIVWFVTWIIKYDICKQEYDEEAKFHLIRKNMGISRTKWQGLEDSEINDFMKRELWKYDNYKEYKKEKELEMKEQLAENARYKQYRRYMKKGGPGQMTFGPE